MKTIEIKISFSPPDMTGLEVQGVFDVIRSGWITTGLKTKEFERQIAEYCHGNKAVCLNSQTTCAEMVIRLLGIGGQNGGTSFNFIATLPHWW
ncbi:DegT/DnrJ/EryC1/StrS family aminotransferase [Ruminococcus turbiniformis]|uniref:DegT/DnrJ/EryC1/StrS family aminotransferase n=1 Tax=Ruminococcus turbiniformis TaxID=2881258 RepID=UPI003899A1E7